MANCVNPIQLTYLNGTGYVFDGDDYMRLRTEYRIVGAFVGTCNIRGWTPGLNGLPVELNQYETQLLLVKGYAVLLNKSVSLLNPPDNLKIKKYEEFVKNSIEEQEEFLKNNKVLESKNNIQRILAGKISKSNKRKINTKDTALSEEDILNEIRDNYKFDRKNALLEIPYKHPFEHDGRIVKLEIDDSLHFKVFKDLWEKGNYITAGECFGADFIVYPNDPVMFHASHIIIVLNNSSSINAIDMIAKCRLSVMVNKKCVFAYYNSENELTYQTIEWENWKK